MKYLRVILLFLLLGAIVNVAVAWGIAYAYITQDAGVYITRRAVIANENEYIWRIYSSQRTGFIKYDSVVWPYSSQIKDWGDQEFNPTLESWRRRPSKEDEEERNEWGEVYWQEFACGWPCLSMWARVNYNLSGYYAITWPRNIRINPDDELEQGVLIERSYLQGQVILPFGLIRVGFVFNMAFYAVILWLLIPGPFALRRIIRHKRGLCVKCAYDLRGAEHEACPECGLETSTR